MVWVVWEVRVFGGVFGKWMGMGEFGLWSVMGVSWGESDDWYYAILKSEERIN